MAAIPVTPEQLANLKYNSDGLVAAIAQDVDTKAEDHAYDALRGGLVRKVLNREERRRAYGLRTRAQARRLRTVGEYGGLG